MSAVAERPDYLEPLAGPCALLWQTVLVSIVKDVLAVSKNDLARLNKRKALAYVGTFPSKDFRVVCDLAGLDPDELHRRLLVLISGPERDKQDALHRMILKSEKTRKDLVGG